MSALPWGATTSAATNANATATTTTMSTSAATPALQPSAAAGKHAEHSAGRPSPGLTVCLSECCTLHQGLFMPVDGSGAPTGACVYPGCARNTASPLHTHLVSLPKAPTNCSEPECLNCVMESTSKLATEMLLRQGAHRALYRAAELYSQEAVFDLAPVGAPAAGASGAAAMATPQEVARLVRAAAAALRQQQENADSAPSQPTMLNALARPKKTKMMVNGGGIPLTASGSAVAPAVSPLGAKKPRKPTVKKEKDDAAGSASGVAAAAVAAVQVATPEKPEKPERGKGRPRKIRPLEPGTTAAAAAAAAAATTAAASAAAAAAAAVSSANTLTPNGVGTPNAAASSSSASQPKNLSSVTARRRQEKEENAPFPWKPNSVKPIRMDPRTGQIAVGDPDSQCPPGFVDCWPCPQAGCNERHASDRQLATHIRMAHDDGKWRCPLYPGECNKTYKLAHHVALHYSGVHEGVRHHACTWEGCGLFFLNRGGLMQHYNFIHLKRNVDPATGKMVSSPSLATHSAPSGKPSKRKRGRSVDDSAVPGGAHAATAVSDGDDMSTAPESPIAAVRRSASTTGLARGRPRNSAVPVDRGTRADDEDDDDGDDDDDDDDEHVVADGHAPPDAARRASESQWRAEAAAASAQRQMMRASAPHPALEMDFDIADHHFDHFKHTSAFEAPNDSFGFLPSFNDEDTHATMMLQSDDMLGGHDAFGPIHHDHDLSARTQRGVGGSDRKTNGHFAGDVDALALDEDHFGNGQSLAIPPV